MPKKIDNQGSAKTPRSTMTGPSASSPKIPAGARVPVEPGANAPARTTDKPGLHDSGGVWQQRRSK